MKIFTQASVVKTGQDNPLAWPKDEINKQYWRGGESSCVMKSPNNKNITIKEEMKTSNSKNVPDSQNVNLIIRTAAWVRARGQMRPISEDPVIEEQVGILFNIIRRRKNITLEKLANQTDYKIEELIAFEAGLLKRLRMCEMLPKLTKIVGVNQEKWLRAINPDITQLHNK